MIIIGTGHHVWEFTPKWMKHRMWEFRLLSVFSFEKVEVDSDVGGQDIYYFGCFVFCNHWVFDEYK